jgi:hypothetical protein
MIPEAKPTEPIELAYDEMERAKEDLARALHASLYSSQRVLNALIRGMQWKLSYETQKALVEGKAADQIEMARIAGKVEYIKDLVDLRDSIIQEESNNAGTSTSN